MNKPHSTIRLKGLTLLETLVSVTIITLVIVGPLTYIATSSSYARQTKDVMSASYLAEEGVELLQNRYDSLYILCNKQPDIDPCTTTTGETTGEIAWRVFKEKFSNGGGFPSCFRTDNPAGCSFDYIDMEDSLANFPPRYTPQDTECATLAGVSSSTFFSYVCNGEPTHIVGTISPAVSFKRIVYLDHLPTFESADRNLQHNDDMRITSEVRYRAINGATRSVRVIRFIHPRP